MTNNYNNIKLPIELTKNGFASSNQKENQIDKRSLSHIIELVEQSFHKTKAINYRHSSYGLKHIVGNALGTHVANGDLIASMIICGYKYKADGINCSFNVSTTSVKQLIKANKEKQS